MTRLFDVPTEESTDAWYTPGWVFSGMGITFDLDVAAPPFDLPWLPASRCYTATDDGLAQPWHGVVWCNPPYSAPREWALRWAAHPEGALLIRADLSSSGPFVAFSAASSLYVPPKRIQFVDGAGKPTGSVNFSTVILGRGPVVDAALGRLAGLTGGSARLLS